MAYEVCHDWGHLPGDGRWGTTHGVAIDKAGQIYILHTGHPDGGKDCVQVFHPDGTWANSWGERFVDTAHGLEIATLNGEELALVTDQQRGLYCCSLTGEVHWRCEKPRFYRQRPHLHWSPSNAAVDSNGHIHLADGYGSYFITVLDANGHECDLYGGPGMEEHHLNHPHGLACVSDADGREFIVVAENRPGRLHWFDCAGRHQRCQTHDSLTAPRHARIAMGYLYIPDLAGRLGVWSLDGEPVAMLGESPYDLSEMFQHRSDPRCDMPPGRFVSPHDVAIAADGTLYVVEWVEEGRISRCSPA